MKTKLLLIVALSLTITTSFSQKKINKTKQAVISSVEGHKADLINISDEIWSLAETAFEENKSSKLLADYAEKQGFKVERGVAGIPTAFVATYG
ncbi:Peptidase M20D, amidohydrolase, partial [hydrothermal vent metagenome]